MELNKKLLIVLVLFFAVSFSLLGCSSSSPENKSVDQEEQQEVLIDVKQFYRITPEELIAIMGEPKEKDDWTYNSHPVTTYYYDLGENDASYQFMIIDNVVVQFSTLFDYYDMAGLKDKKTEDIFAMFGVEMNDNVKCTLNNGITERYNATEQKLGDFYITRNSNDEVTTVRATYDLRYFE